MKKYIITLVILFAAFSHADAAGLKASTLRVGSTGETVISVQKKLVELGYDISADGKFGSKTAKAVADFQLKNNIPSDGLVGAKTLSIILAAKANRTISDSSDKPNPSGSTFDPTLPIDSPTIDWLVLCRDGKPHVRVTSPNGNEVYTSNQQIPVTWKTCNVSSDKMIHLSIKTYQNGTQVNIGSLYSAQTGTPKVPNTGSALSRTFSDIGGIQHNPGKNYKVSVSLTDSTGAALYPYIADDSDSLFTINDVSVAGSIQVLSPNGGETYYLGAVVNGQAVNQLPEKAKINSSKIGSVEFFLVDNASVSNPGNQYALVSAGGFNPLINNVSSSTTGLVTGSAPYRTGQYYLMAKWRSNDGTENFVDFSDKPFTIIAPAETDVCRNISGVQTIIPTGMIKDSAGNCVVTSAPSKPASSWESLCSDGQPHAQIISPNGNETYRAGQQMEVKWKTCNHPAGATVQVGYTWSDSRNGPGGIQNDTAANDGIETYDLGVNAFTGDWLFSGKYYKAFVGFSATNRDYSDNFFTIWDGNIIKSDPRSSSAS